MNDELITIEDARKVHRLDGYRGLLRGFANQPIAIWETWLRTQMATTQVPETAVRANPRATGNIAVIPLIGPIQQREDIWTRYGFAVSADAFARQVQQAVADPSVKAIILDVDSPGGLMSGVPEASDAIFKARGSKPIVAVANSLMASAAYWIASSADEVVATPSSYTGSIGAWILLIDETAAWESMGVKMQMVKAGKYKAIGNPYEPLTDEVIQRFQARVDDGYSQFVNAIARNRGTTAAAVRSDYGEGDVLNAPDAKAAGLVDRVATLAETVTRFGGSLNSAAPAVEDETPELQTAASFPARSREKARLELAK